jgi:hypothetical protein
VDPSQDFVIEADADPDRGSMAIELSSEVTVSKPK